MLTKKTMRKRWIKQPLSHHSMAHHLTLPFQQNSSSSSSFSKVGVLSTLLVLLCSLICSPADAASVIGNSNSNNNNNNQIRNRVVVGPSSNHGPHNVHNSYRFLDRHNEYDSSSSGVSILDDDTLRLSLAIDDDSSVAAGLSAPSLHTLEPKVYLRVSGESGMLRPASDYIRHEQGREASNNYNSRASSNKGNARTDLQSNEDDDEHQVEHDEDFDDEDEDMNDNYHHHFPYIESYREKYVKPELNFVPITTPPPPPTQVGQANKRFKESKSSQQQQQQDQHVWSDIIAQVTTPSSFNEINSSASEHRLADLHFRQHLPSYFYNKYSSYSEEDLENVADLDDEHSKYFVKTRPRSVTTSGSNIYSNFYYEPPSFSTKSVPIPVKTNKEKFVFATVKPTRDPQQLYADEDDEDEDTAPYSAVVRSQLNFHDDEEYQRDVPVMTTISPFLNNVPSKAPQQHPSYNDDDREEGDDNSSSSIANRNNKTFLKASSSAGAAVSMAHYDHTNYQSQQQNASGGGGSSATNKSPLSSFDVSPSQSIQSKVTVSRPQLKSDVETTPATPSDDIAMMMTTSEKIGGGGVSTEPPPTTTTDATSIPGVPGVDYPTLDEIPQTGFDCKNQRYKGFFADIDAKCQAWHYCDFTDGHSTFLCPNGTLFSQVLLTCDWWFNVDCNQAKQLYVLNERLYRYIKPPKPSFPEDFIGEHVDKWLIQQLQMGLLPKVRKKAKAKLVPLPPPQEQPPPTPAKSN